jgi:hypothetical protein
VFGQGRQRCLQRETTFVQCASHDHTDEPGRRDLREAAEM